MWSALFGVALKYERRKSVILTVGGSGALSEIPKDVPMQDVLCHRFWRYSLDELGSLTHLWLERQVGKMGHLVTDSVLYDLRYVSIHLPVLQKAGQPSVR